MAIQMDEEEEKKRSLVREYLLKKKDADKGVSDASTRSEWLGAANALGRGLTEYGNASRAEGGILYNGFDRLSDTPKIIRSEDRKWDDGPLDRIAKAGLESARDKRDQVFEGFKEEQTLREADRNNRNAPLEDAFKEEERGQTRTEWARKNKNAPLEDEFAEDQRGFKRYEMEREKKLNAFDDQGMDPNSPMSKNVGLLYKNVLLSKASEAEKAGDRQAAADLRAMAKNSSMSAREQYESLKMMRELDWRDILDRDAAAARARAAALPKPKDIDPMVQKASEKLANHQSLQEGYKLVEEALGAPLSRFTADIGKDKVYQDGKERDLPGFSIKGLGRFSGIGKSAPQARALEAAASRIFNTTLSDRSGAAVTNQELERLRGEFQSGRMNTEAELIKGLQDFEKAAVAAMKNAEAGYSPQVLDTYRGRGGKTSADYERERRTGGSPEARQQSGEGSEAPKRRRARSLDDL